MWATAETGEPDVIVALLKAAGFGYARLGLEAGPMSQWVATGLLEMFVTPPMAQPVATDSSDGALDDVFDLLRLR